MWCSGYYCTADTRQPCGGWCWDWPGTWLIRLRGSVFCVIVVRIKIMQDIHSYPTHTHQINIYFSPLHVCIIHLTVGADLQLIAVQLWYDIALLLVLPLPPMPVWTLFMVHFRVEILRGPINIWQRHLLWRLAIIKWGYKKFVTRCAAVSAQNCLFSFSWTGNILYSVCIIYLLGLTYIDFG